MFYFQILRNNQMNHDSEFNDSDSNDSNDSYASSNDKNVR